LAFGISGFLEEGPSFQSDDRAHVDAVAYDPDNKMIFASNREGMVSAIHQKSADEYESAGEIQTPIAQNNDDGSKDEGSFCVCG
jgi:hypothetical protein